MQTKDVKKPVVHIIPLQPTRNKSMDSIFHPVMTILGTELDELIYYTNCWALLPSVAATRAEKDQL